MSSWNNLVTSFFDRADWVRTRSFLSYWKSFCLLVLVYSGHVTGSFYIKLTLSPDDMYLATGSADSRAYIYCIGQRTQHPFLLSGHQPGEVSVPRWCVHDPTRLVSLSDNAQLFVWRMYPAREYTMPVPGQHAGKFRLIIYDNPQTRLNSRTRIFFSWSL